MWHKLLVHLTRLYLRRQVRRLPPRPLGDLDLDRVQRVLIINSTALGDLLFSTPALWALKTHFPAWEIDLLVQPGLLPLVQQDPRLARCWAFPGRSWRLLTLARLLRARGYGLVIILHGNDPEVSLLAWLTGAPSLIGSAHSPLAFAYSHAVPAGGPGEHAIERRLNFIRPLGVEPASRRMEIFLPPEVREGAAAILREHFGGLPVPLVALHPAGSERYKHWPREHFAALGKDLHRVYGAAFLMVSSANERGLAQTLAERIGAPALVTGGRFDLLTVAGLLSHCQLLVGNDSGPLHLALALQIPSIGLLGADHPRRIGPYQVDWGTWVYKDDACPRQPCTTRKCPRPVCLEAIGPGEVFQLVQQWWEPKFFPRESGGSRHDGKFL